MPTAKENLQREGFQVRLETHSPGETELKEWLQEADAVGIRSKTQLTRALLESRPELLAVGAIADRADEPMMLIADVTRLSQEVGFHQMIPLEQGLTEALAYWREMTT